MNGKHQYHEINKPLVFIKNIDEVETRHKLFKDPFQNDEKKVSSQNHTVNNN